MKLSVSLSRVPLRHITVVSFLINVPDAVTCRVEVKLEFRLLPLLLVREAVNEVRFKVSGGVVLATNKIGRLSNELRHSRTDDPNTRQVNVTRSPGHVNRLSLFDVSSTFSNNEKDSGVKEYEDATNNII